MVSIEQVYSLRTFYMKSAVSYLNVIPYLLKVWINKKKFLDFENYIDIDN